MNRPVPLPALRDRTFDADDPVKVSICCIAFNHESFIADCLEGFLDQRAEFRIEVVIYDDASSDRTQAIISDYAARHPSIFRTILMRDNQYSKGVNPYFAYVFPAAKGDYLAICDGDDFWSDPNKLARQVAILDTEPGTALTFGRVRGIDDAGMAVPDYLGGVQQDLTLEEMKAAPGINTATTCFRNIFRQGPVSLFARTSTVGDLMVWAMLGYHGRGRFLPDIEPANYRIHAGGLFSMQVRERQCMMVAVGRLHIAAYHAEQGDKIAHDALMRQMVDAYSGALLGSLQFRAATEEFPAATEKSPAATEVRNQSKLTRWRKSFTRWRKRLGRSLAGARNS